MTQILLIDDKTAEAKKFLEYAKSLKFIKIDSKMTKKEFEDKILKIKTTEKFTRANPNKSLWENIN